MSSTAYNLRPLWDALLDVYRVIQGICERHGLRYYACGGTALGAVRHAGFIPWDDDFDLFMPRPDYMKFVKIAQEELPSGLRWSSIHCNPRHRLSFGNVSLTDTSIISRVKSESGLEGLHGIFIDVLPLDGIPVGRISLFFWLVKRALWRRFGSLSSQEGRLRYERWISRIPFDESKRVEDAKEAGKRLRKYRGWPRELFSNPDKMGFENVQIPMPSPAARFLRNMFGENYMQLPPEDQRHPSHQDK